MDDEYCYEPSFAEIPTDVGQRWTLLREFVAKWHGLDIPIVRDCERIASRHEQAIGQSLTYPLREWAAFGQGLVDLDAFNRVLRDEFDISRISRLNATTLMIQGEGDVYWGIVDANADSLDPPVEHFSRDFDAGLWRFTDQASSSLTSFVLSHMAYFLGTGFVRTRDVDEQLISEMQDTFPVFSDFDGLLIFEMPNLISFVRRRSGYNTLIVARRNSLPKSEMPDCLQRMHP
ncbi:MAG: hypothetical protein AAFU85_33210 [Planctomycetota bacterium]